MEQTVVDDYSMVLQAEKLYTAGEFWALMHQPEFANQPYELVEGVLVEMSRSDGKHGMTVTVYHQETVTIYTGKDVLNGADMLPGLTLAVKQIFA